MIPDEEYHSKKRLLELELESLIIPEVNAAREAGRLIIDLPRLWASANASERRKLILSLLDVVYVDAKQSKSIIAIKLKPPFIPIFQVAVSKKDADIHIIKNGASYIKPKDQSVFLVETGEGWTPSSQSLCNLVKKRRALFVQLVM
jgi:site-specific DNA recombinase